MENKFTSVLPAKKSRPLKYNYPMEVGDFIDVEDSKSLYASALAYAKKRKWVYRSGLLENGLRRIVRIK